MMIENAMSANTVIQKSMQGTVLRNDVILNNIANADTPGYKRKTLSFEGQLSDAIEYSKHTKEPVNLDSIVPLVREDGYSYRLDENNVSVETEMVSLYQNASRYDAMANSVMNNYKRINAVMQKG